MKLSVKWPVMRPMFLSDLEVMIKGRGRRLGLLQSSVVVGQGQGKAREGAGKGQGRAGQGQGRVRP